ncbi:MAG: hypothetical protein J0H86_00300 [Xanthomonadaceae bacterium]|nr:hypothetical protein [Xanthomonadaceae bacterium]
MTGKHLNDLLIEQSPHHEDFEAYQYEGSTPIQSISRIGWIRLDKSYKHGLSPKEFVDKLSFIKSSKLPSDFHFHRTTGGIPCTLCSPGDRSSFDSELLIPRVKLPGNFFGSPSMIDHFIVDHGYRPPDEFIESVMLLDLSKPFDAVIVFDELSLTVESIIDLYRKRVSLLSSAKQTPEIQRYQDWLDKKNYR